MMDAQIDIERCVIDGRKDKCTVCTNGQKGRIEWMMDLQHRNDSHRGHVLNDDVFPRLSTGHHFPKVQQHFGFPVDSVVHIAVITVAIGDDFF